MRIKLLFFVMIALSLVSCAETPQQISVLPPLATDNLIVGQGQSVALTVTDERADPVLGSRGGVYAETSVITLQPGFEKKLQEEISRKLAQRNFIIDPMSLEVTWQVKLLELSYEIVPVDQLKDNIVVKGKLGFEMNNANKTFTKSYGATRVQPMFGKPSDKKNSDLVNMVIADMVNAMLSDQQVADFLND
ncbi:YajG family lipoprotein [Gynuella sp.]|uniref:YajG family lipoprotein n=1 Tax=Gynuella sp. TaxID=2969146 RepID=UPI003D0DD193